MVYLRLMLMVAMMGSHGVAGAQDALSKSASPQTGKRRPNKGVLSGQFRLYEKAGLAVEIHGGGPGINIPQLLGAGAIEFGMGSNSSFRLIL